MKREIIEEGPTLELFKNPQQPTTRKFLNTISQRNISASIVSQLNLDGTVAKLLFTGQSTGKPLLAQVSKKFDVEPNILNADIIELKNGVLGNLIVHMIGEPKEVEAALAYLRQQEVVVEELEGE